MSVLFRFLGASTPSSAAPTYTIVRWRTVCTPQCSSCARQLGQAAHFSELHLTVRHGYAGLDDKVDCRFLNGRASLPVVEPLHPCPSGPPSYLQADCFNIVHKAAAYLWLAWQHFRFRTERIIKPGTAMARLTTCVYLSASSISLVSSSLFAMIVPPWDCGTAQAFSSCRSSPQFCVSKLFQNLEIRDACSSTSTIAYPYRFG